MIEGFILRAGNQADVQEKLCSAFIGGIVSAAKADVLGKVMRIAEADSAQSLATMAWGVFCPFTRDRFKALQVELLAQATSCLFDHAFLYEKLLHREILSANFPISAKVRAWDDASRREFTGTRIEGKTLDEALTEILNLHGKRIMSACESSVVERISASEFIVRVGSLVDSEMEAMRTMTELCFSAYAAQWVRKINEALTESISAVSA